MLTVRFLDVEKFTVSLDFKGSLHSAPDGDVCSLSFMSQSLDLCRKSPLVPTQLDIGRAPEPASHRNRTQSALSSNPPQ
jgi:hypothetical protein